MVAGYNCRRPTSDQRRPSTWIVRPCRRPIVVGQRRWSTSRGHGAAWSPSGPCSPGGGGRRTQHRNSGSAVSDLSSPRLESNRGPIPRDGEGSSGGSSRSRSRLSSGEPVVQAAVLLGSAESGSMRAEVAQSDLRLRGSSSGRHDVGDRRVELESAVAQNFTTNANPRPPLGKRRGSLFFLRSFTGALH